MNNRRTKYLYYLPILVLIFAIMACGFGTDTQPNQDTPTPTVEAPEKIASATPTPTPTSPPPQSIPPTDTPPTTKCSGLSGELEVRILVGPADIVGLKPVAVGTIPFSVTTSSEPYLVQGAGPISYSDILVENWGTYGVTMDLQITIDGECLAGAGEEQLDLTVNMTGQQMVEVTAEGFHGEYPWSGKSSQALVFPLVDGAHASGEGWVFVLHLNN